MKKLILSLCLLASLVLCTPARVQASISIYTFDNLPQNTNPVNGAIGEDQIFLVVSDEYLDTVTFENDPTFDNIGLPLGVPLDDGEILLTFFNTGDYPCALVDVYVYDGVVYEDTLAIDGTSPGVAFTVGAQPFMLPGTEYAKLVEGLEVVGSADADPGELIVNGVDPGEWLSVTIDLQDDVDFSDVYDAILAGDLLIGIRVHFWDPLTCAPDGEEQFLNSPVPIPAPGAIFLGGIGIVLVGWLRRRRTL